MLNKLLIRLRGGVSGEHGFAAVGRQESFGTNLGKKIS